MGEQSGENKLVSDHDKRDIQPIEMLTDPRFPETPLKLIFRSNNDTEYEYSARGIQKDKEIVPYTMIEEVQYPTEEEQEKGKHATRHLKAISIGGKWYKTINPSEYPDNLIFNSKALAEWFAPIDSEPLKPDDDQFYEDQSDEDLY